jgi:S1-C subfamily serine protease
MRIPALLALLLAFTGCSSLGQPSNTLARKDPPMAQGTGFLVRPDGLILTAWHVVKDAKMIGVRCEGRERVLATLGERSQTLDVALLHVPLTDTPYLSTAPARSARKGDPVFTLGYPAAMELGPEPKFSDGTISALSGGGRDGLRLLVTVPIQPGSSGGPVIGADGTVVGIVTATQKEEEFWSGTGALPQNLNWAVKIEHATPLFDLPSPQPPAKNRAEAIERASRAMCIVITEVDRKP